MTTAGIILCGGQSSRMGQPKAWLPFGDETLLGRVVRILGEVVRPIVVVAAPGQDLPPLPADVRIVRDEVEGQGPLQGLVAGLTALQGQADAAFLTGCDAPFLQPAFVRRLIELRGELAVCIPKIDDKLQTLAAVYDIHLMDTAIRLLAADRRALHALCDEAACRIVTAAELADVDPTLRSLRNLNTPEDYQAALPEA